MSAPTLVVIGSGPGIALAFTKLFAQRKLSKIALLSRSSMRLEDDKKAILESVPGMELDIKCWGVDIAKKDIFEKVLAEVSHFGDVSCVLFNAAKVVTSEISKFPGDEIITDFTANFSLLLLFTYVHIALLNVADHVSLEHKYLNPPAIAQKLWDLYQQEKKDWTLDSEVSEGPRQ
ncbi:putative short-chain alcohol protein [Botrytis cinerea BcDW1]|uniref:Putative short-chain alcohol protein n=1 Tax=Botryotinia fuckeliana (strain BcDW1) TaxID=1290391 RepID=M7URT0_BOTF1|nr:putative short-chain alcohol protein [Botrytis cinerea BcDW1]